VFFLLDAVKRARYKERNRIALRDLAPMPVRDAGDVDNPSKCKPGSKKSITNSRIKISKALVMVSEV